MSSCAFPQGNYAALPKQSVCQFHFFDMQDEDGVVKERLFIQLIFVDKF